MVHINKAQIVNLNPTINKDKKLSQNFNLKELIKKLTSQAENYIKKDEYYRQIDVGCEANDPKYYAKGIAFSIQKDNTAQDKHMLWVSMLHTSMQIENSKPLAYGNKEEIVKFLKDEKSIKQIEEKLNTLSEELKNN